VALVGGEVTKILGDSIDSRRSAGKGGTGKEEQTRTVRTKSGGREEGMGQVLTISRESLRNNLMHPQYDANKLIHFPPLMSQKIPYLLILLSHRGKLISDL
jgi:hypothetical protein